MKKLTPFQRKVARWYLAHPKIHKAALEYGAGLAILVDLIIPGVIIFWFKMRWDVINSTIIALAMSGAATFAFMISISLTGYVYRKYVHVVDLDLLPECAIEDARKIIEKYPKFADLLKNLSTIANKEDDGTYLREHLDKIGKWIDLKAKLADASQTKNAIEIQIAALEKALG